MKIAKVLIIFTLLLSIAFGASVEIRVNSTRVTTGERLDVKIIAEGKDVTFPKIDNIDGVAVENLKTTQKSQMRIINGAITQKNEKILQFSLYPDKNITIPRFRVKIDGKKYLTQPIEIEVVKGQKKASPTKNFSISTYVDKKAVYVGEPIIFTVDVSEPNNSGSTVAKLEYLPPEFKGFFVKQIGGEKLIRKKDTTIHQLKYLLTPQKSGKIVIPPAGLKVGVEDINAPADPFGLFGAPIKWYSLRSKSIDVEVLAPPKGIDLIGDFKVNATVDKSSTKANEPVNYTLEITGEGSLEDLEDPIFNIPGVTIYSDAAQVKSKLIGDKLISTYIKKYVFISDRSFTIPEVKFKEFNFKNKKEITLKTKSFDIKVEGSFVNSQTQPTPNQTAPASAQVIPKSFDTNGSILEDSVYYAKKEYEEKAAMLPFYSIVAFIAGMMAMFALMKLLKNNKRVQNFIKKEKRILHHYTTKEALDILYPHTSDSAEVEEMVKRLYLVYKGKRAMHTIDKAKLDELIKKYDKN